MWIDGTFLIGFYGSYDNRNGVLAGVSAYDFWIYRYGVVHWRCLTKGSLESFDLDFEGDTVFLVLVMK
jgi:hypothetical protein